MELKVNGIALEMDIVTLQDLIEEQKLLEKKGIAVSLNENLIPRANWLITMLEDGDDVLILEAVQGG